MQPHTAATPKPDTKTLYEWQQSRRRPEYKGGYPLTGLGCPLRTGQPYTMWLPPNKTQVVKKLEGMKLVNQHQEALEDPELIELRDKVIRSLRADASTLTGEVDAAFVEFIGACLARNYVLSDEEASMLLLSGAAWHSPAVTYLLGGEGAVKTWAHLAPATSAASDALDAQRAVRGDGDEEASLPATSAAPLPELAQPSDMTAGTMPCETSGPARPPTAPPRRSLLSGLWRPRKGK